VLADFKNSITFDRYFIIIFPLSFIIFQMKNLILAFSLIFAGSTAFAQSKAPSVIVQTPDGQKVDFSTKIIPGKINVVSFWATWCGPCKKELNNLKPLYKEWQAAYNVNIVAVSIDDSRNFSKVKPYVDGQRWEFDVLVDTNSDLKRALNFQSVPHTTVFDANGVIVFEHDGYVEGDEFELEEELKKLVAKK
jgi:cytochrome c biogenesis protein CcmG, thiol:disulfide interchange protein DsbE